MKRNLPSLLAVRYFEAVGRNLSFTLAANELNVTQAAVSHQVRLLEEETGVKLFNRLHQRIELTSEGQQLLEVVTESLNNLAEAFDRIAGRESVDRIHLSVTPYISARWLAPRIDDFLDREKNIEIIFLHSLEPPNERDKHFDLKIFFTTKPTNDPAYELMFSDELVPLCAPDLLKGCEGFSREEVIAKLPIAHEFSYEWWAEWCRSSGIDPKVIARGHVYDDPTVLENVAISGRSMILGSRMFLAPQIRSGALVLPFGDAEKIDIHYHLHVRPKQRRRTVNSFRRWLLQASDQKPGELRDGMPAHKTV